VKEIIDIDLPRARTLDLKLQAPFVELERRIWRLIEQDARIAAMMPVA
jgi:NitT/TauT family transport system ATP-binding protein